MVRKTYERIETHRDRLKRFKDGKEKQRQHFDRLREEKEVGGKELLEFVDKVAAKLKDNLPKSEVWFNSLLEKDGLLTFFKSNIRLNRYIPDLVNFRHKIVIEVDGSVHLTEEQKQKDLRKDHWYRSNGFKVFRVVAYNEDQAYRTIVQIHEIISNSTKPTNNELLLTGRKTILRKKKT